MKVRLFRIFYFVTLLSFIVTFSLVGIKKASATVMLEYSIAELSKQSDSIIIGRVVENKCDWNAEKTKIYTYTTVEVISELKGAANSKSIVIKELGGIVGEIGLNVEGSVEYTKDEDVLIFLNKLQGMHRTLGMMQGKYNIITDKSSGVQKVIKGIGTKGVAGSDAMILRKGGTKAAVASPDAMDLSEMLSIINSNK